MQKNTEQTFSIWLQNQFAKKSNLNPKYSLRAFARYLGMDASAVSQIMKGTRQISPKLIERICQKLEAHPFEKEIFLKPKPKTKNSKTKTENDYIKLSLDVFSYMSEWYHFAILELTYVKEFKYDLKWIAQQLSISTLEAELAIDRMIRLGILMVKGKKLVKTDKFITNDHGMNTNAAKKELQRQFIQKTLFAIDEVPQELKDITSITFAIDIAKMDEAKEKIKKFRREMSEFLEEGNQTEVYNLNIQLFPLTNKNRLKGVSDV